MNEKWYEDFNWGGMFLIAVGVITIILFLNLDYLFPEHMAEIHESNKEIAEQKRLDRLVLYGHDGVARESVDCDELQSTQLYLIGKGANADTWVPMLADRALKIAKERAEILC